MVGMSRSWVRAGYGSVVGMGQGWVWVSGGYGSEVGMGQACVWGSGEYGSGLGMVQWWVWVRVGYGPLARQPNQRELASKQAQPQLAGQPNQR